jgi:hypothetical protein
MAVCFERGCVSALDGTWEFTFLLLPVYRLLGCNLDYKRPNRLVASRYTPRRTKKSPCFSCIGGRLCARSCASEVPNPWPIKWKAWWRFLYVSCSTTFVDGPGWSARRTPSSHLWQCGCSSWRLAACRQRGFLIARWSQAYEMGGLGPVWGQPQGKSSGAAEPSERGPYVPRGAGPESVPMWPVKKQLKKHVTRADGPVKKHSSPLEN